MCSRNGVRLLGSQAALLDREVGPIARRVDVLRPLDSPVVVDRDEAIRVCRQAIDPGPSMIGRAIASAGPIIRSPGVREIPAPSMDRTWNREEVDSRALNNSPTAALAAGPNIAKGADSGVITAIFTSRPRSAPRRWVIRASS